MELKVFYQDKIVGTLNQNQHKRMCFTYHDDWINDPTSFPISQSLPLSGLYEQGIIDHSFFTNLLPEAAARENICRSLGISHDNDFELLSQIGGECAGALQIVTTENPGRESDSYEPISMQDLQAAVEHHIPYTRMHTKEKLRLSLAGAQDKWPVYVDGDQLFWPNTNTPSSHILKFTHRDYKGLNWNEAYTSFLARQLGLPVVEVTIGNGYTLTKRFDRTKTADGKIVRLHQEDFCQAAGYPFFNKYEDDGGPLFADCINLVKLISSSSGRDQKYLLQWQELNLLLGNADGHAKNLSILYAETGPELAPFYDLVSTSVYQGISRNLAFSVGGNSDPGQIRKRDWIRFAEELGMRPRIIMKTLNSFIELLEKNLTDYHQHFIELNGSNPVLDRIDQSIRRQLRRTQTLLSE